MFPLEKWHVFQSRSSSPEISPSGCSSLKHTLQEGQWRVLLKTKGTILFATIIYILHQQYLLFFLLPFKVLYPVIVQARKTNCNFAVTKVIYFFTSCKKSWNFSKKGLEGCMDSRLQRFKSPFTKSFFTLRVFDPNRRARNSRCVQVLPSPMLLFTLCEATKIPFRWKILNLCIKHFINIFAAIDERLEFL